MRFQVHKLFERYKSLCENIISQFEVEGKLLAKGSRNTIKIFEYNDLKISVKKFKKPNLINRFVYRYFRDSKAKRSYDYAQRLLAKDIGTPQPIAYFESNQGLGLGVSYYFCEHIDAQYTYRDLVENPYLPNHEQILRSFTRFCIKLHQEGIEFKDHSPGNTLIKESEGQYAFYLVDLNRMNFFQSMSFEQRMKNLCRLTPKKEMVQIMANEYAKYYKEKSEKEIFELMWQYTSAFQAKFFRKQRWKKRLKFWKK